MSPTTENSARVRLPSLTRTLEVLVAAYLGLSPFIFVHTRPQAMNAWIVAGLVVAVSFIARGLPRARFVNLALGAWLFLSVGILPTLSFAATWNTGFVAVLLMIATALPNRLVAPRGGTVAIGTHDRGSHTGAPA